MHRFESVGRRVWPLVAAALVVLAGLGPAKAAAQTGGGELVLFDGANFTAEGTLTRSSVPDFARFGAGWAGRISSLRVLGGIAVAAYTQPNYAGTCETFTSQDLWLGDNAIGNDAIRSVKLGFTCNGAVPGPVVVTDVDVIKGSTRDIACPQGFTKKLQNLNEGAGGDYVYACVKWGPRTTENVLWGVDVQNSWEMPTIRYNCSQAGERLIDVDLNSGVGDSNYEMFCLVSRTRSDAAIALQDIDFVASSSTLACTAPFNCSSHDQRIAEACASKLGEGATGTFPDLNAGAAGKYIYLCQKRTSERVPITQVNDSPPTITMIDRTAANPAGWNRGNVTVTWRCTAGGSALTSAATVTRTLRTDGANQSAVGVCTDLAGHEVSDKVTGVNIDMTPPQATLLSRTAPNAAGWNGDDVVVTWTCSDGGSGPEQATISSTVRLEGDDRTATGSCRDLAGNRRSATEGGIDIDRTPPALTLVRRTPQPSADNWNNSDVRLMWTCDDSLSGVDLADRTVKRSVSGEGAHRATASCHDRAGNATTDEQYAYIDQTPPTLRATAATSDGRLYAAHTWTRLDVKVKFNCSDQMSGVAGVTPSQTISTSGANQSVVGVCTDKAGNRTELTYKGIDIDRIAPVIVATRTRGMHRDVTVSFACSDPLSGVVWCPEPVVVGPEGQEITGEAVDRAGNKASVRIDPHGAPEEV